MSGGVDSCVAAHLLKRQGYAVIGVTFKIWPKSLCGSQGPKSCCSQIAIKDARLACARLGIPHYVLDCEKLFQKEVIAPFLQSYKKGLTPNPCIVCNNKIKFPLLLKKAKETRSDYIATGHHARCVYSRKDKSFLIEEGRDKKKDQSYVLFGLKQHTLSRLLLPVGNFKKEEIRAIAKRLKLSAAKRKESQEICFIVDDDLPRFLKDGLGKSIKPGLVKDKAGRVLGEHQGSCFYTIGQRRGLRIAFGRPMYITAIDSSKNEIIVGEYEDTLKTTVIAKDINWLIEPKSTRGPLSVKAKIRYNHAKAKACIRTISSKRCEVKFSKPQSSPTPGQAVVFYDRDKVIAGGWIT